MCLAKTPAERPADAKELARMLERCDGIGFWTAGDAERWWRDNMSGSVRPANQPALTPHVDPDAMTTQ